MRRLCLLATLRRLVALSALGAATAQAAPMVLTDLVTPFTQSGVAQRGDPIALGSGLTAVQLDPSVGVLGTAFANGTLGVLGANAAGGITFANTGTVLVGPAVETSSTRSFGLAPTSDIAFSAGLWVGIGTAGGLLGIDPRLGVTVAGTSTGLFDTRSELLGLRLDRGRRLFGEANPFGSDVDGLLGVTPDGRLRFVQTTNGDFGGASMLSRTLGFVADGGLARAAGFIVGVNARGSLNAYDPFFDLLFSDIGPSGLFSLSGGLEALDVGAGGLDARFVGDDVRSSRGVLGVSTDGGLAYVRLDIIASPTSGTGSARTGGLGLAAQSALAISSRSLVNAFGTEPLSVPEPATPALLLAAGLVSLLFRRRAAPCPA